MDFVVIEGNKHRAIFRQELAKHGDSRIHHAKPLVMTEEVFSFLAHSFPQPFADEGTVNAVVVNPAFVPRIIRRIDIDAFDMSGVGRQ